MLTLKELEWQNATLRKWQHIVDKYCVTYDSDVEDTFFVHTGNKVIKFAQERWLYCYTPNKKYLQEVAEAKGLSEDK